LQTCYQPDGRTAALSGNIAYKLLHRIGGAELIGPLLTGLSKPVHGRASAIVFHTTIGALASGR